MKDFRCQLKKHFRHIVINHQGLLCFQHMAYHDVQAKRAKSAPVSQAHKTELETRACLVSEEFTQAFVDQSIVPV